MPDPPGSVWIAEKVSGDEAIRLDGWQSLYALTCLPASFLRSDALKRWSAVMGSEDACSLWVELEDSQFIIGAHQSSSDAFDRELAMWRKHGWEDAWVYRRATRDYEFVSNTTAEGRLVDKSRMLMYGKDEIPPPLEFETSGTEAAKQYAVQAGAPPESLPNSADRQYGALPNWEGVSRALDYALGVRGWIEFEDQGTFYLKAVPSGGARHPVEGFLIVRDLEGIDPGVYHFSPAKSALVWLSDLPESIFFERALYDLPNRLHGRMHAVLVVALDWKRAMWRYRDDRSFRAPLIDAGHACGAFKTALEARGVDGYIYTKFDDRAIAGVLMCDLLRLTPVALVGISGDARSGR